MLRKKFSLLYFLWSLGLGIISAQNFQNGILKIEASFSQNPDQKGTAIVVGLKDTKLYLITAKHLIRIETDYELEDALEVEVVDRFGSSRFKVNEIRPIDNYDLAILIIEDPSRLLVWNSMEFRIGKLDGLKTDTRVTAIGFPAGEWDQNSDNAIKNADRGIEGDYVIFSNLGIKSGFSGGALVKGDGRKIVGMIIDDSGGNKAQAIRMDRIVPILNNQNIPINFMKLDPIATSTTILELLALLPLGYGLLRLSNGQNLQAAYESVDAIDGLPGLQANAIIQTESERYYKGQAESKIDEDYRLGGISVLGSFSLLISGLVNELFVRKKQKSKRLRKRKK